MSDRQQYHTKRRAEILEYLRSMQGQHVTANDIRAWFDAQGKSVSGSTIYRQLDHMLEQGLIQKYLLDETSSACYEYIGKEQCHPTACFHCKCVGCGKLIHLHCGELEKVNGHLAEKHGFLVDLPRTVFYGLCEQCERGTSV